MRTIKVEIQLPIPSDAPPGIMDLLGGTGNGGRIHVSTEAVVEDDHAREAGQEAARAVNEFIAGYGEVEVE